MRDAFGGIVNITFIVVFMLIVSGYMAFSVSYNKAFKVKNKIITVLEQYEDAENATAKTKIREYLTEIGYNATAPKINDSNYTCDQQLGYCTKWVQVAESDSGLPRGYYKVVTAVYVDIPIFNKFLPFFNFFQVSGDTKTIYASH